MASFVISGNETTTQSLATGEYGLVTQTGTLSPAAGVAITMAQDSRLTVLGTVYANSSAISLDNASDPALAFITIGATGQVIAANGDGIRLDSGGSRVFNAGLITAIGTSVSVYEAVELGGDDNELYNTGEIFSNDNAIEMDTSTASGTNRLENFGSIIGRDLSYDGGIGADIILNSGEMSGDIDLSGGADRYDGRSGSIFGDVSGGDGDDTLLGGANDDTLLGDNGNDTLSGGAGDDTLNGGNNDDTLIGGAGADTLDGGEGIDLLNGGDGEDLLLGGNGDDTIFGGEGADDIRGNGGVDIIRGGAGDDLIRGGAGDRQNLQGNGGEDTIFGGKDRDTINGGIGDDEIFGEDGNDNLIGAGGDDIITGGEGDDAIRGGSGDDIAVYDGASTDFDVFVGANNSANIRVRDNNAMDGDEGFDTLQQVEFIEFSDGIFAIDDLLAI